MASPAIPSPSRCRLEFGACLIAAAILAWYALRRWPPFDDFRYLGDPDAHPLLATLDYGAAALLLIAGPLRLAGWRRGRFLRPEKEPGFIVTAVVSLMAGAVCLLLFIGALKGVLSLPPVASLGGPPPLLTRVDRSSAVGGPS